MNTKQSVTQPALDSTVDSAAAVERATARILDLEATLAWHLDLVPGAAETYAFVMGAGAGRTATTAAAAFAPTSAVIVAHEVRAACPEGGRVLAFDPDQNMVAALVHLGLKVTPVCTDPLVNAYRAFGTDVTVAPFEAQWPAAYRDAFDAVVVDLFGHVEHMTPLLSRAGVALRDEGRLFITADAGQKKAIPESQRRVGVNILHRHRERLVRILKGGWSDFTGWDLWVASPVPGATPVGLGPLDEAAQQINDGGNLEQGVVDIRDVLMDEVSDAQLSAVLTDGAARLGLGFAAPPQVEQSPMRAVHAVLENDAQVMLAFHEAAGVATLSLYPATSLFGYVFVDAIIAHLPRDEARMRFTSTSRTR